MNTILWVIISWGMDTRCNWTEKMFRGVSHQCINDPDHFHSNSTDDDVDDDNRIDESAIGTLGAASSLSISCIDFPPTTISPLCRRVQHPTNANA